MEPAVTSALIAVGGTLAGVVLGWALQWRAARRAREDERNERRDRARREREIVAAERLDDALVRAFSAFQGIAEGGAYQQAFNDWSDGWIAYSGRVGQPDLHDRYQAVATMLMELIDAETMSQPASRHHAVAAIRNARVALSHFIRDEGRPPPSTFPKPSELVRLLNEGEAQGDRLRPLREWLREQAN